ncbi:MAG: WD40-repeat-containing domain protein [Monoraphidium minutum]|nr:MAG: WD40-repeat-containing domain protein [Monoraphidium minutum]
MGLPDAPAGPVPERSLPAAPTKVFPTAHKGAACCVAVMRPGHFIATGGADRAVYAWDLNTLTPANSFTGAGGTVNDAAFTQDGRRLLAACADKRLLLWNFQSGRPEHTLTGHGGGVVCVAASALDAAAAVSAGEDRCVKVWDLHRGFCVRSLPCAKMPTALALSLDGTTILTGHLDGTLCIWDSRQDRAGGKPLAELRDSAQAVLSLCPHYGDDSVVLSACKDSTLRLWDFRALSVVQTLKAPGFSIGCVGSMGRARCTADISADGRFVAAGAADGSVYVWDLKPPSRRGSSSDPGAPGPGGAPAVTKLAGLKEQVAAVGWAYDGTVLAAADKTGAVAFWALAGGGGGGGGGGAP